MVNPKRFFTANSVTRFVIVFLVLSAMLAVNSACSSARSAEVKEKTVPPRMANEPLARSAKSDLAKRLGIDVDQIKVVRFEEVTWRDGSLGCPRAGMAYTQALVNGVLIELEASGRLYRYHSRGTQPPFYCAKPSEPLPPSSSGGGSATDKRPYQSQSANHS